MAYVHNNLLSSLPQTRRAQGLALLRLPSRKGERMGLFTAFPKTTSVPPGYAPRGAFVMPYTAGDMAALASAAAFAGAGNLVRGGPMAGNADIAVAGDGNLALTVGLDGAASISFATSGALALSIGLSGDGTITMTGSAALAMIVPFNGAASFSLTGSADLRGLLSLSGSATPFTELSPQNLAAAVWQSVAGDYTSPGTMGEKLNTAGSGGLSPTQATQLAEIYRIHGLEVGQPLVVSPTTRTAGAINQTINTASDTTTVART
jgi:hypothetical protein